MSKSTYYADAIDSPFDNGPSVPWHTKSIYRLPSHFDRLVGTFLDRVTVVVAHDGFRSTPRRIDGHGFFVFVDDPSSNSQHQLKNDHPTIYYHDPEPPLKLNRIESWGIQDDGASWQRRESSATAILWSLKSAPVVSLGSMLVAAAHNKSKAKSKSIDTTVTKKKQMTTKAAKDVSVVVKKKTKPIKAKRKIKKAKKDPVLVPSPSPPPPQRWFPRQAKEAVDVDKALLPSMTTPTNQTKKKTKKFAKRTMVKSTTSRVVSPTPTAAETTSKPSQPVAKPVVSKSRTTVTSTSSRRHSVNTNDYAILTMTDRDVLSGRGNGIAMLAGNCAFRKLVAKHRHAYSKAQRHEKCALAQVIIDAVHDNGGRFLEKHDLCDKYRVMDHGRILEKTSQALRERCTNKR